MSMHTISRNSLLNSLEWFLVIVLAIFGLLFFCWPMFVQYRSKQSSLSQSKTDVRERPTLTICFDTRALNENGDNDTKTVDYSKHERFTLNEDFTIQYSSGKDPTEFTKISNISEKILHIYENPANLTIGTNIVQIVVSNETIKNETVKLEQYGEIKKSIPTLELFQNYKGCYKISTPYPVMERARIIKVNLNKTGKADNHTKLSTVASSFFITSDKNANGILKQDWIEGQESSYGMEPGTSIAVKLQAESYKFLNNCSNKMSYYECLGVTFMENYDKVSQNIKDCTEQTKKCTLWPFPGVEKYNVPLCIEPPITPDFTCSEDVWDYIYNHIILKNNLCQPACSMIRYDSKIIREEFPTFTKDIFQLIYDFGNPLYMKVFEEYVIMDEMSLVGNVGGTMGMFIGFSFSGVIGLIISCFIKKD